MYRGTVYRLGATQAASYTDTAAAIANGFGMGTRIIRVNATTGCHIAIGQSPTATTSNAYLKAGEPEYLVVNPGEKLSAIRTATNGSITVTECS